MEVDDQQINLDRFSLFFPEKRPFFLENAGAFTVSNRGGGFNHTSQTELFFSRRIGIGAEQVRWEMARMLRLAPSRPGVQASEAERQGGRPTGDAGAE